VVVLCAEKLAAGEGDRTGAIKLFMGFLLGFSVWQKRGYCRPPGTDFMSVSGAII